MKRWKYRFYVVDTMGESLPSVMDRLGDDGWEIFQVRSLPDGTLRLYMKKEKQEDEE